MPVLTPATAKINVQIGTTFVGFNRGDGQRLHTEFGTDGRGMAQFAIREAKLLGLTPSVGDLVGVWDRGGRIFGGTIAEVRKRPIVHRPGPYGPAGPHAEVWYEITAEDWTASIERNIIPVLAVDNDRDGQDFKSAGEVVRLIIDTWLREVVYPGRIEAGVSPRDMGTVIWRGMSCWAVIRDLADRSGFTAWVDTERSLNFHQPGILAASQSAAWYNKNYLDPEVATNRNNKASAIYIARAYDGIDPHIWTWPAQDTYPKFAIFDPADPEKKPRYVDRIREVRFNGAAAPVGQVDSGYAGAFYYREGSPIFWWDKRRADIKPTPDDRLTIEFWEIGQNVMGTLGRNATGGGKAGLSGTAELYIDAPDKQTEHVLPLGVTIGGTSSEYRWKMFSRHLAQGGIVRVSDIYPGTIIVFDPSTTMPTGKEVVIRSVTADWVGGGNAEMLYQIEAADLDVVRFANPVEFMHTLAESKVQRIPPKEINSPPTVIGWNLDSVTVGVDVTKHLFVNVGPEWVMRLVGAEVIAKTAPSVELKIDIQSADLTTGAFSSIFAPDQFLILPAGATKMALPQTKFRNFVPPDFAPTSLANRTILRLDVVSGGDGATDLVVSVAGHRRPFEGEDPLALPSWGTDVPLA